MGEALTYYTSKAEAPNHYSSKAFSYYIGGVTGYYISKAKTSNQCNCRAFDYYIGRGLIVIIVAELSVVVCCTKYRLKLFSKNIHVY